MEKETIIKEIQQVAKKLKKDPLSQSEFLSNTTVVNQSQIYGLFDGWNDACRAAGLKTFEQKKRIDNNELFKEMRDVFIGEGKICTRQKFGKLAKFDATTYRKHFGGKWETVLSKFRAWLIENKIDFPLLDSLPKEPSGNDSFDKTKSEGPCPPKAARAWDSSGGTTYGSFLNFRGLQHAPVNEQGVVFLFGMVCSELGFAVEAVRTGYPDCEAKRRVDKTRDERERVKIEFELYSSNFKEHGHNPKECNVIVCWEHDWKDCPLEVVELKSEIQKLDK